MIIITKDKIVQCNEIKLEGDKLIALVDNCEGCSFVALDAPNEGYALALFEVITKDVASGKQIIDLRDEEVRATIDNKALAPIKEVDALEAITIARSKKTIGLFMHVETVNGKKRYIAIDNAVERAYVEAFDDEETCKSWLRGEFEIE